MTSSKWIASAMLAAALLGTEGAQAASWVNGDVYGFTPVEVQSATAGHPQQQAVAPVARFYLGKADESQAVGPRSRDEVKQDLADANRTGTLNTVARYFPGGESRSTSAAGFVAESR